MKKDKQISTIFFVAIADLARSMVGQLISSCWRACENAKDWMSNNKIKTRTKPSDHTNAIQFHVDSDCPVLDIPANKDACDTICSAESHWLDLTHQLQPCCTRCFANSLDCLE